MKFISAKSFLKINSQKNLFDIRTIAEYDQGHISEAISLPLFNNEERAEIGTIYKKKSKDLAVLRGLELVGPKLADFVRAVAKYKGDIYLYCWRGGMRSKSMGWLLETSGKNVIIIEGGYKAYRNALTEIATVAKNITILGGTTGSGKTDVLKEMEILGAQIIDLEGLANHKGSSFGALGQLAQPSTEQFQNLVLEKINSFDLSKKIWVESESKSIGWVFMPDILFNLMEKATLIKLQIPREARIARLVREYACFPKDDLEKAVVRVQKRLGGQKTKEAVEAIYDDNFHLTADILLQYYDKAYEYAFANKYKNVKIIEVDEDNPSKTAKLIVDLK